MAVSLVFHVFPDLPLEFFLKSKEKAGILDVSVHKQLIIKISMSLIACWLCVAGQFALPNVYPGVVGFVIYFLFSS
jgi:hypothetical protein